LNPHTSVYSGETADSAESISHRTERTERFGYESKSVHEAEAKERSGLLRPSADIKDASSRSGGTAAAVEDVDEDIMAFYHAKEELLKRRAGDVGR